MILTSNNIDSVACFTICAGVIENRGLKKVVLDGNPIGEQVRSVLASLFCSRHCALHWKNSYHFFYLQIIIIFYCFILHTQGMKALMLVPMIAGNRVKVIFLLMYLIFILVVNNEWCFFTFFWQPTFCKIYLRLTLCFI